MSVHSCVTVTRTNVIKTSDEVMFVTSVSDDQRNVIVGHHTCNNRGVVKQCVSIVLRGPYSINEFNKLINLFVKSIFIKISIYFN